MLMAKENDAIVLFDDHGEKWVVTLAACAEAAPLIGFKNAYGDEIAAAYLGDRAEARDLDLQEVVPYFLDAGNPLVSG